MKYEELPSGVAPSEFFAPLAAGDAGRYDLWYCDQCHVLFEKDDAILERMIGAQKSYFACPLRKKKSIKVWLFKFPIVESCLNRLEGWDETFFVKQHDIVNQPGEKKMDTPKFEVKESAIFEKAQK